MARRSLPLLVTRCNLCFPYNSTADAVFPDVVADSGSLGRLDCAARRYRYRGLNDVLFPVARAGGNIARQRESCQRCHRDVMCPADARFQHATAPNRHTMLAADGFNALRLCMSADAAEFDIDDATRTQFDRVPRIRRRMD